MTRAHRNGAPAGGRVGVLHSRPGKWSLLVAERRTALSVLEARTFDQGQEAEILTALAAAGVTRLVRVAPANQTVARTAQIPSGPPEEVGAAAALMAEGMLPDDVPGYRRAAGPIPQGDRGARADGLTVLLTAWRNGAPADPIAWPGQRWTTEVAALAFLCGGRGAAIYAPFGSGALSLVAAGSATVVARVLVDASADRAAWRAQRARHLAETCAAAGVSTPETQGQAEHALGLSPEAVEALRASVTGAQPTAEWLDAYGIALGAAMGALSPDPLARRLAELLADAPTTRAPAPERLAAWLARPRNAAVVIVAAVVAALVVPLGLAGARLAILTAKAAAVPEHDRAREDIEHRAALYRELDQTRWPMTKLWADISAAVPEGVTAEALRLSPDQGLSMQGVAESNDLLTTLHKNLNDTGLFDKLKIARSESTSSGVSFDLSAEVVGPHTAVKPIDDFAARPLAVRLYGEGAANVPAGEPPRDAPGAGRAERRPDRGSRPEEPPGPRPSRPFEIPPELSDDQIASMDRNSAMLAWSQRKSIVGRPGLDPAVKSRLESEIPKLFERMGQTRPGGGS